MIVLACGVTPLLRWAAEDEDDEEEESMLGARWKLSMSTDEAVVASEATAVRPQPPMRCSMAQCHSACRVAACIAITLQRIAAAYARL